MNPDLKEVFVPSKGTRNPRFWAQIAAMYAFRVLSENAYTTAQFAMYSVYTSVYTRIRIMYGSVLNKPTAELVESPRTARDLFLSRDFSFRKSVAYKQLCIAVHATPQHTQGYHFAVFERVFIPTLPFERSQAAFEALCMQRAAQAVSFLFAGHRPLVVSAFRRNMHSNSGGCSSPQSIAS